MWHVKLKSKSTNQSVSPDNPKALIEDELYQDLFWIHISDYLFRGIPQNILTDMHNSKGDLYLEVIATPDANWSKIEPWVSDTNNYAPEKQAEEEQEKLFNRKQ